MRKEDKSTIIEQIAATVKEYGHFYLVDTTAMNALKNLAKVCQAKGIAMVFSHVNEQPMHVMEKAGFVEIIGEENFRPNISAALERAEEIITVS